MSTIHSNNIPNFVQALTPRGLRLAMLRRNAELGYQLVYFDIQFVKKKWIAWYNAPSDKLEEI